MALSTVLYVWRVLGVLESGNEPCKTTSPLEKNTPHKFDVSGANSIEASQECPNSLSGTRFPQELLSLGSFVIGRKVRKRRLGQTERAPSRRVRYLLPWGSTRTKSLFQCCTMRSKPQSLWRVCPMQSRNRCSR